MGHEERCVRLDGPTPNPSPEGEGLHAATPWDMGA